MSPRTVHSPRRNTPPWRLATEISQLLIGLVEYICLLFDGHGIWILMRVPMQTTGIPIHQQILFFQRVVSIVLTSRGPHPSPWHTLRKAVQRMPLYEIRSLDSILFEMLEKSSDAYGASKHA
jgi:hypothetical protein